MPPPPPGGGGGDAQIASLEAQMNAATAAGQFELCISLREQINNVKAGKRRELEAQIAQAAASSQFERCIQLRQQLNAII